MSNNENVVAVEFGWNIDLIDCGDGSCQLVIIDNERDPAYKITHKYESNFRIPLNRDDVKGIETTWNYLDRFEERTGYDHRSALWGELYQALLDYAVIHIDGIDTYDEEKFRGKYTIDLVIHTKDGFSTLHVVPGFYHFYQVHTSAVWSETNEVEFGRAA